MTRTMGNARIDRLAALALAAGATAVAWLAVGLGPSGPAAGYAQQGAAPPKRVYVVVVDGLEPVNVNNNLMPNLTALRKESTWYEQARSVFPAETLPNHAAMMTGLLPKRNGIVGNYYLQDQAPSGARTQMEEPRLFRVETLTTRLERACGDSLSTATILSKNYLFNLFRGEDYDAGPQSKPPASSHPDEGPNRQLTADFHWFPQPQIPVSDHAPDAATMDQFRPWIRSAPTPQFALVNLGDVDRAGHADDGGTEVEADGTRHNYFQQAAIRATDTLLGDFVKELKTERWWQDTVMIVLADHGMEWARQDHWIDLETMLTDAGYIKDQADQQFTIINNGGADMVYIKEKDPEKRTAMIRLIKQEPGVERVFSDRTGAITAEDGPEELRAAYGQDTTRSGDVIAIAEPGYSFNPGSGDRNPVPGVHGHTATQHPTLLVTGGHPSLATAGPGALDMKTVAGAAVWDPGNPLAPPEVAPRAPQGGPGTLSITPTVGGLYGLAAPTDGYDGIPLAEAFDPGALTESTGICEGLGAQAGSSSEGSQETATSDGQSAPSAPTGGDTADAGPHANVATTFATSRTRAVYGQAFRLSGAVADKPGCPATRWVEIQRRVRGAQSFSEYTETLVGKDGRWAADIPATRNASYRAVPDARPCNGLPTTPLTVLVDARVKLGGRCENKRTVRGALQPAQPGTRAYLQRRTRRGWRPVGSDRLDRRSRFVLGRGCRAGRYRVVWPTQGTRNTAAQRAFRV